MNVAGDRMLNQQKEIPKAWLDMLDTSNMFPRHDAHHFHKCYGLKEFIVIAIYGNKNVPFDETDLLLSIFSFVALKCKWWVGLCNLIGLMDKVVWLLDQVINILLINRNYFSCLFFFSLSPFLLSKSLNIFSANYPCLWSVVSKHWFLDVWTLAFYNVLASGHPLDFGKACVLMVKTWIM